MTRLAQLRGGVRARVLTVMVIGGTLGALVLFAGDHHGYDLLVYRGAVRTWLRGGELYGYVHPGALHQGFTYPPFAAICLIPLAGLPLGLASALNEAGIGVAITWTTWVLLRPLAHRYRQPVWLVTTIGTCVVCLVEPVRDTMGFGQVNLYLAALVLGDFLLLRRGSPRAGIGIGLAAAVKLTPALFIVFLFASGRRRAGLTAAATAAGATLLAALVAPSTSAQFWGSALVDTSRVGSVDSVSNQSLAGLLTRLLDVSSTPALLWLPLIAVVLAVGLRRAVLADRTGNDLAALALVGLTAGLVSPISWTHHLWWVVPAAVVLLDDGLARRRLGPVVGAVAVTAVFASSLPEHSNALVGENAYVLTLLVLLVTLPVKAPVAARSPSATPGGAAWRHR